MPYRLVRTVDKVHPATPSFRGSAEVALREPPVAITKPIKSLSRFLPAVAHDATLPVADFLIELRTRQLVAEKDLHKFLNALFDAGRYGEIVRICIVDKLSIDQVVAFNMLRLFRVSHVSGLDDSWVQCALLAPEGHFLKPALCNSVIDCLVRVEDVARVSSVLGEIDDQAFEALTFATIKGACNLFVKRGRLDLLRAVVSRQPKGSADRDLYFMDTEVIAGVRPADDLNDWRKILTAVQQNYAWINEDDKRLFDSIIATPLLSAVNDNDRDFLDIRHDVARLEKLKDIFRNAIKNREPLSLIRLGDGESYAFPNPPGGWQGMDSELFTSDRRRREEIWWGRHIDDLSAARIQRSVHEAISNATVLGVPSVHRIIRDLGKSGKPIFKSPSLRGIGAVLHGISQMATAERIFTEERCHQVLFDRAFLAELSGLARKVIVVSCWTEDELGLNLNPDTEYVKISPHNKVKHLVIGQEADRDLVSEYATIADSVEERAERGVLVLVAAGIIGKIFIERARARGAVALDVGAVVDYFAGHKTRSIADMV